MEPNTTQSIENSFTAMWAQIVNAIPELIVALLVVALGWIVGAALKRLIMRLFDAFHLNRALDAAGVDDLSRRAGYRFDGGAFVGSLVKWFVIIVAFVAALDILNFEQVTNFFNDVVLGYLPQVFAAVLILFVGMIVASFAQRVVQASGRATSLGSPRLLGRVAYGAIVTFTILAVLNQLDIAPELVQLLFAGLVFALSLAFGLAFGLGGRGTASQYLEQVTRTGAPDRPR